MVAIDEIEKVQNQLSNILTEHWIQYSLFKWQWWLVVVLSIAPWIIWWKIVDQKRIYQIFSLGCFIALVSAYLDVFGWAHYTWTYRFTLLPTITPMIPMDFSVLPVLHMLIYQRFRTWKSYFWAELVTSLIFALIAEPVLIWIGIYKPIHWKSTYSILPYMAIPFLGKWLIEKMKKPNAQNVEP